MKKTPFLSILGGALLSVAVSANAADVAAVAGDVNKAVSTVKQISHLAQDASAAQIPVLFAAVPEPSTWLMLAVGIPVLLLVVARHKKKAA